MSLGNTLFETLSRTGVTGGVRATGGRLSFGGEAAVGGEARAGGCGGEDGVGFCEAVTRAGLSFGRCATHSCSRRRSSFTFSFRAGSCSLRSAFGSFCNTGRFFGRSRSSSGCFSTTGRTSFLFGSVSDGGYF